MRNASFIYQVHFIDIQSLAFFVSFFIYSSNAYCNNNNNIDTGNNPKNCFVQKNEFAQLCPFEYGNSVYLSRAMLNLMGDTTEYRNDCELMNNPIEGKSSQIGQAETIVMVYPNPTNGQITLETNATLPETLYLYNFMGQLLDKFVITTNFTIIDLSKFNQQILFYRFCEKAGIINVIK